MEKYQTLIGYICISIAIVIAGNMIANAIYQGLLSINAALATL